MSTSTPEFVSWTIPQACPMRELGDWRSPSQTERLLRPLRASSIAIAEGRVFEGLARLEFGDEEHFGFDVADALAVFGEIIAVDRQCAACPANASLSGPRPGWAGCYGELARDENGVDLAESIQRVWEGLAHVELFPPTHPAWYGLWMNAELTRQQLLGLELLFSLLDGSDGVREFLAAVRTSLVHNLSLIVDLSPAGELVEDGWIVAAHCPDCRAERGDAAIPGRRRCPVCRKVNHPQPNRKRKRRGRRPYRPLSEL